MCGILIQRMMTQPNARTVRHLASVFSASERDGSGFARVAEANGALPRCRLSRLRQDSQCRVGVRPRFRPRVCKTLSNSTLRILSSSPVALPFGVALATPVGTGSLFRSSVFRLFGFSCHDSIGVTCRSPPGLVLRGVPYSDRPNDLH